MIGLRLLEELEGEARYHRERFDLYKAKTYGPKLTSDARLKELERRHRGAESRLRQARAAKAEQSQPAADQET